MSIKENIKIDNHPLWLFLVILLLALPAAPVFRNLLIYFIPCLEDWSGYIELVFISLVTFLGSMIVFYIKREPQKVNEDWEKERFQKAIRVAKINAVLSKIFKYWPLNIITLKFIPLTLCWLIDRRGAREYNGMKDVFDLPNYWEDKDLQEKFKKEYFSQIIRVGFYKKTEDENSYRAYEIKFSRNFEDLGIREREIGENNDFSEDKIISYKELYSKGEDKKLCAIISWTTVFGLFWNILRLMKNIGKCFCFNFKKKS